MSDKIYTKKGDEGQTKLFGGKSVPKYDLRVESYGTIDELNSHIGSLLSTLPEQVVADFLSQIQILLFDIGSHLATDPANEKAKEHLPKLGNNDLEGIEHEIDRMQNELPPLKHFILPAGSSSIAQAHICRTVCRRAERRCSELIKYEEVDSLILPILNRLSDYFFVFARYLAKEEKIIEIKWTPRPNQ